MKELDQLRAIYLSPDIDEETRADNAQRIEELESALASNEAFASWREHDTTKQLIATIKASYRDFSLQLAADRTLTEAQRLSLFARQDACKFILSLADKDAKGALEQIHADIKRALEAA